jgi:hypothetical protein
VQETGGCLLPRRFAEYPNFLVYALDPGKIFPVSPDKMPRALFTIELAGLLLAIPLTLLSLLSASMPEHGGGLEVSGLMIAVLVLAVLLGIGIVVFATGSAMNK